MAEKTYTYYGPMSGVTLAADENHPQGRQVQFIRGGRVTVPDDNDYIRSLVARGHLKPVADATDAAPPTEPKASATAAASTGAASAVTSPSATEAAKPSPGAATESDKATAATTGTTSTTTGS